MQELADYVQRGNERELVNLIAARMQECLSQADAWRTEERAASDESRTKRPAADEKRC
jgi:hypothetical protein